MANNNNIRGMQIAHLNIRGLSQKFDEVRYIILSRKIKIFCLAETFLDEEHNSCLYMIPGYEMIRRDRPLRYGGGLLCYIHNSIAFDRAVTNDHILAESLTIKITPRFAAHYVLSFIYRPPDSLVDWNEDFLQYVEQCNNIGNGNEQVIFT